MRVASATETAQGMPRSRVCEPRAAAGKLGVKDSLDLLRLWPAMVAIFAHIPAGLDHHRPCLQS
jgi:hypothetical protein